MKIIAAFTSLLTMLTLCACKPSTESQSLVFATSPEYPPFEYKVNGELRGFDIDLAKLIAKELGKEAIFQEMQFSTILPTLQNGQVDAAISTITVTQERKQNFDFSQIYYTDDIAAIYKENHKIHNQDDLAGKKIGCQLGSTMEIWLKKNGFKDQSIALDNNNQAIEALKANHVSAVLMDGAQAQIFSKKNPNLAYHSIAQSEEGYAIVTQKGSPKLGEINAALESLKKKGEIAKLESKWLTGDLP
jgi:polar amino acid transport system substrate-binding protein